MLVPIGDRSRHVCWCVSARARLLVLPARFVSAHECETFTSRHCVVDGNYLRSNLGVTRFGLLTELRDGSVHLSRGAPFGIKFLDLSGRDGLVGLAGGAIHGLDPQDAVLLVIAGEDHSVAFLHCVEESPSAIQAWRQEQRLRRFKLKMGGKKKRKCGCSDANSPACGSL